MVPTGPAPRRTGTPSTARISSGVTAATRSGQRSSLVRSVTGTGSVRDERLGTRPLAGLALDDLQNPARAVTGGDVPGDVLVVGQHDAAAGDAEQPHTGVGDLVEGTQQGHRSGVG